MVWLTITNGLITCNYCQQTSPFVFENVGIFAHRHFNCAAQPRVQVDVTQACGCPVGVVHVGDGKAPCGL